jgi:lysophospholipase L1-like esterase
MALRLALALGVLGLLGGLSAGGAVPARLADFEWVLTKTEVNPGHSPQPPQATGTARSGHIDYDIPNAPQTQFDIDFNAPPARLRPGDPVKFTITVKGQITGGTDTQGFRTADAILLVNDRWDGHSAVGVGQNCNDPIGAEPISCTKPASFTGTLSAASPTYGDTFTIGIGLLNCGTCYVKYTYTAKKAGTAAKPKPTPAPKRTPVPASKKVALAISWTMPTRFGIVGSDGLTNYFTTTRAISPPSWRVDLVVRPKSSRSCKASDAIAWSGGGASRIVRTSGCRFAAYFTREGRYTLTASLRGRDGVTGAGTVEVTVQDWLIFGLGDSNGSGEGAPDVPSPPLALDSPVWHDLQCDRSANSFEAQAARSIENGDPRTSVTFVHLACSGASIAEGLLGAYGGINPGTTLDPQLLQMKRLAGKREIDAVVISIGVNDLGFADMVKHCILYPTCQNRGFPSLTSPTTLAQVMAERIAGLPKLYDRLSHSLKALGIPARHVFLTEYFDSTRDQNKKICDPLIKVENDRLAPYVSLIPNPYLKLLASAAANVPLVFDRNEAAWANQEVLVKLNKQVRAAATKHGWRLVTGVADAFQAHGYCSSSSWITGLYESLERQHDANGTLHANTLGDAQTAKLAVQAIRRELYPNGPGGPPRAPK